MCHVTRECVMPRRMSGPNFEIERPIVANLRSDVRVYAGYPGSSEFFVLKVVFKTKTCLRSVLFTAEELTRQVLPAPISFFLNKQKGGVAKNPSLVGILVSLFFFAASRLDPPIFFLQYSDLIFDFLEAHTAGFFSHRRKKFRRSRNMKKKREQNRGWGGKRNRADAKVTEWRTGPRGKAIRRRAPWVAADCGWRAAASVKHCICQCLLDTKRP